MLEPSVYRQASRRFLVILAISVAIVFGFSEIAHLSAREAYDHPPGEITLTIPPGTADRIAAGGDDPAIPDQLTFVVGDTLVVYNDDSVAHELGPLFIPPGSQARLNMDSASNYEYDCSFKPTNSMGLVVRQGTTLNIRLLALVFIAPATAVMIFVYSLAIRPIKPGDAAA